MRDKSVKQAVQPVDKTRVHSCPQCGATVPATAAWCAQCYLPVSPAEPAPALVAAGTLPSATTSGWLPPESQPASLGTTWPAPAPSAAVWPAPAPSDAVWPAPAAVALAGYPPPATVPAADGGRLLGRRAAVLVAVAIGLGGVIQLIGLALSHVHGIEPDTLIRYDILLTLLLYAVVATMVISQITPSVRLHWGSGSLLSRIAMGVGLGAGLSAVLLYLVSTAAGHLQPDPRIVLMMSEGDPTHIVVTIAISCVAAPLIEETLFRGLLLESLRPRGTTVALLVSAVAFAAWHLMPAALVYYSALGLALGGIYLKRGLAASIAAHVGFNGVLVVAAIAVVLGPSHQLVIGGLELTAPSGWSQQTQLGGSTRLLGPADASLDVAVVDTPGQALSPDMLTGQLRNDQLPFDLNATVHQSSVQELSLPVGEAAEAAVTTPDGRDGEVVILPAAERTYGLLFMNAGSEKAKADFTTILDSLHD